MTEKITCPCCGSNDTNDYLRYKGERYCPNCDSAWYESKRKPPTITSLMTWDWFCNKIFESDASIESVTISISRVVAKYATTDKIMLLLGSETTKRLGWQDMPERGRNEE